jgi:glycosyltransferase involved in cell wall biosynthesis
MIVKNESHCLERCITSVLPYVDAAVIVDTGSSDGTQALLRELLASIPCEVLEQPWKDFGYNRTQAFWSAADRYPKAHALIIDADEELFTEPGFAMPALDRAGFGIWQVQERHTFLQPRILKLSEPWVYQGELHEVAECLGGDESRGNVVGCHITGHFDSARNQDKKAKYLADAATMERMPQTPRNVFYKAQCYKDAEDFETALRIYEQRASMIGFEEETYLALLLVAHLKQILEHAPSKVAQAYERAYRFRPTRAEAPWYMARFLGERKHSLTSFFENIASGLAMPQDQQGLEPHCYGKNNATS